MNKIGLILRNLQVNLDFNLVRDVVLEITILAYLCFAVYFFSTHPRIFYI